MATGPTRLLLGLGNPGPEYDGTRHNVGFELLDRLAGELGARFASRGRALVARAPAGEASVVLAKPQTFMNLSGRAARDLLADLGARVELLVAYDDFHLPLGRVRLRTQGSHGGHKGMASVLACVTGRDVPRLRLGIGEPPGRAHAEDWVLRRFGPREREQVDLMLARTVPPLLTWLADGRFDALANAVNPDAAA